MMEVSLYRRLTGSNFPHYIYMDSGGILSGKTARKSPIGSTNHQWNKLFNEIA
ncbi:hypothetical protein [Bacillus sp. M6-12]|uniref:hypothetical protein n=1 Tax=Bacillus sp. M6-12 TaxID=2054166 RepID=UPI0015E0886A|nr:hypothetical protein [Bacillus sp. M6-12]